MYREQKTPGQCGPRSNARHFWPELLLEAKGFTDVVVSITDESADVVLDMGDVTDAKRAQVEDIVKRKTGIAAEHIVITPITQ